MIVLFSYHLDNKLEYAAKYIFEYRLGLPLHITDDIEDFKHSKATCKINYSAAELASNLSIPNTNYFSDFRLETIPEIQEKLVSDKSHRLNIDILAACFFLLARVEEYNNDSSDSHGRYPSSSSELSKRGLIEIPVIDYWIQALALLLTEDGLTSIKRPNYTFESTIDIDHFFAFKHKPFVIRTGSVIRDVLKLDASRLKDRWSVQDPYDRVSDMLDIHDELEIKPTVFVLTSERGKYDKNIHPDDKIFSEKVKGIKSRAQIGVHPSYESSKSLELINTQKRKLESISGTVIQASRQHFLRLSLPATYRALLETGIEHDYSMGYADTLGYRAGTSVPFYWYDLEKDITTKLLIHPFQIMDVTLKNYLQLSPEEAIQKSESIIHHNKVVSGQTCVIWHNSSFYANEGWAGWETTYKQLLSLAKA